MNCPICKNEEIKEGQNFCQICGFDLKAAPTVMTVEEIEKYRMSENVLDELCSMQKRYAEIYSSTGLAGIEREHVHLSEKAFRATFPEYQSEQSKSPQVMHYTVYNGTKFICLSERL